MNQRQIGRRRFLARGAGGAASVLILPSSRLAFGSAANERLNLAVVGVAGYVAGTAFMPGIHRFENVGIAALCDVDQRKRAPALELWRRRAANWPASDNEEERRAAALYRRLADDRLPVFEDFRRMLGEMPGEIDAVVVATPDHTHAIISAAALRAGKPVMSEKPLTISSHEARALRRYAIDKKVATSVNTQGASSPGFRRGLEIVREGLLGKVEEVHVFFSRGGQNFQSPPQGQHPVPPELNWDLWLAQVAWREYHPAWINRVGWRDTSIGQLGNFGPHSGNLAFMSLAIKELWDRDPAESARSPIRVEAECSEINRLSYPRWERIRWLVPARGPLPPLSFTWHHGFPPDAPHEYAPGSRELLTALLRDHGASDLEVERLLTMAGAVLVGSEGLLATNSHNTDVTLLPKEKFEGVDTRQPITIPRSPWHPLEWVNACRGGDMPLTNFEYAGPQHDFLNLGDVATQFAGETLDYDPVAGRIVNHAEADAALSYEYRQGWTL
ncbi:MAG: Gfo/Idh/MocA family oxidoreductase [Thermoguttaceae bacterium]|nr:Gfo/Idh/MocA family oxidoreductase [Thermoguttaceae bacterium]